MTACVTVSAQQPQRLALAEAENLARKNQPSVTTARFTAEAAAELPSKLDAARFPTIYGIATGASSPDNTRIAAGVLNNAISFSRLAAGVTVSPLLFASGYTKHALASAEARAQAEEHNQEAVEQIAPLEVDRTYFDVLRARAVMQVAELFARHPHEEAMDVYSAVALACWVRLRTVLMMLLATIFGLLPMALKIGEGSETYAALARAILAGSAASVAPTVLLVPASHHLWHRSRGGQEVQHA